MALTPGRAATSLAFSTASCVEFEVAPATIGTRPAATSTVTSIRCSHSSCGRVVVSPFMPQAHELRVNHSRNHTHALTIAEVNNLQLLAPGFVHYPLDCHRCSRRGIFLLRMMALENLSMVAEPHCRRRRARNLKK